MDKDPWIENLNIIPISHGPKFNYTLMQFQPKPQWFFLLRTYPTLKLIWKGKCKKSKDTFK